MGAIMEMLTSGGKGEKSTYRPEAGIICLVSGPNCDDDKGYTYTEMEILWRNDLFVLYGTPNFWPVLNKWDHVLCKPIPTAAQKTAARVDAIINEAVEDGASVGELIRELEGILLAMRPPNGARP